MTDLVTFGETALQLSPPVTARLETTDRFDVWAAGAASNVAVAASRLGTDAAWLTKLADTPLGRRAVAELRGHGVTTDVTWVDDGDARQALTFYESATEPREGVVLDDRGGTAMASVEPADLPMETVQDAGTLFLSGESVALSETVAETAGALMRATDGRAVLGLDHRPGLWSAAAAREALTDLFPAADTLVANIDEAKRVLKQTGEGPEVAHGIANEWDFETVVVTMGERGALVYHDATIHERDAVETEAVDVTGQHDAFVGAFLGRRLAGGEVGDALTRGVAAAALTRTIHGPIPAITADEVESVADAVDADSPGGAGGPRSRR